MIDVEPLKAKQLEKLMAKYNEYKSCGYEDEEAYTATINRFTEIDKMVNDLEAMEKKNDNRQSGQKSKAYKYIMIFAFVFAVLTFFILGFISKEWGIAAAAFFVVLIGIAMGDVYYRLKVYDGIKSPKSIKILIGTMCGGIGIIAYTCVSIIKVETVSLSWLILSGAILLALVGFMIVDKICLDARFIDEYIFLIIMNYVIFISLYILLGILSKLWLYGIIFLIISVIVNVILISLKKSN